MDKKIIDQIVQAIMKFLGKNGSAEVAKPVEPIKVVVQPSAPKVEVDWNNPKSKISDHFSVGEALELPSWGIYHQPSEEEKAAIINVAFAVEKALDVLQKQLGRRVSVNVHAWMRPEKANCPDSQWNGQDYNRYIYETQVWKDLTPEQKAQKKVPKSPHRTGRAIDFHIVGFEGKEGCAKIREMLIPHLESLNLRMEDIVGGWVHLDDMPVINKRFFKP